MGIFQHLPALVFNTKAIRLVRNNVQARLLYHAGLGVCRTLCLVFFLLLTNERPVLGELATLHGLSHGDACVSRLARLVPLRCCCDAYLDHSTAMQEL